MKGVLCIEGINSLYSTVACVFTLGPEHPDQVTGASNLQVHVVARTTNCCDPGSCLMNPAQGFSFMALLQMPVRGTSSSLVQCCLGKVLCLEKILQGNPKPDLSSTATAASCTHSTADLAETKQQF